MTGKDCFGLSPLIRFTLLSLYGALVLPLPLLAPAELRWLMVAGLLLGLVVAIGLLSERVETDANGIQVRYPLWIRVATTVLLYALAGHTDSGSRWHQSGGKGLSVSSRQQD